MKKMEINEEFCNREFILEWTSTFIILTGVLFTNLDFKPYNLIISRNWIALIRRSKEGIMGYSINALGFAGYLLATNESDIKWLDHYGPEYLLQNVVDPII